MNRNKIEGNIKLDPQGSLAFADEKKKGVEANIYEKRVNSYIVHRNDENPSATGGFGRNEAGNFPTFTFDAKEVF